MANEEHFKILMQGVKVWNRWRKENPETQPDLHRVDLRGTDVSGAYLSEADLSGAYLSGANFREAYLRGAYLGGANLRGAGLSRADLRWAHLNRTDLHGADLCGADLRGAGLSEADLSEVDLSEADLIEADLIEANLHGANLRGANLSGANLHGANLEQVAVGYTMFAELDLSVAKGLETIRHYGPSFIDIHTIYRSGGKIPEAFLQGAGVPAPFITYIASLTAEAIQYYSCFISYSHEDEAFAQRLHSDLQGKGVRSWFAPEDIQGGRKLYDQIDQAIRYHDKLLLVLSEHSIHSEWVTTEIRRARKAELRDGRRKLFPIRLVDWEAIRDWECFDPDTGKDLALEVREYFVPDFSHWKDDDSYHQAFDRLLHDLKEEE